MFFFFFHFRTGHLCKGKLTFMLMVADLFPGLSLAKACCTVLLSSEVICLFPSCIYVCVQRDIWQCALHSSIAGQVAAKRNPCNRNRVVTSAGENKSQLLSQ